MFYLRDINVTDIRVKREKTLEGLYAYVNASRDPLLAQMAENAFGKTEPFDGSEHQARIIGIVVAKAEGYQGNPSLYINKNGLKRISGEWSIEKEFETIGRDFIAKAQSRYVNEHPNLKNEMLVVQHSELANAERIEGASLDSGWGHALLLILGAAFWLFVLWQVVLALRGVFKLMKAKVKEHSVSLWTKLESPQALRGLLVLAVFALMVIAICLVIVAAVLMF